MQPDPVWRMKSEVIDLDDKEIHFNLLVFGGLAAGRCRDEGRPRLELGRGEGGVGVVAEGLQGTNCHHTPR